MARIIIHEAHEPTEIKIGKTMISICRCGLTSNEKGLCDKSHKKTLDEKEGGLYEYKEDGKRELIGEKDHDCDCGGECGDDCHCKH